MYKHGIPDNKNDVLQQNIGVSHIAFSLVNKLEVDHLINIFRIDGYSVIGEPRTTGDDYYEGCVLDPDGNRIELIFK